MDSYSINTSAVAQRDKASCISRRVSSPRFLHISKYTARSGLFVDANDSSLRLITRTSAMLAQQVLIVSVHLSAFVTDRAKYKKLYWSAIYVHCNLTTGLRLTVNPTETGF